MCGFPFSVAMVVCSSGEERDEKQTAENVLQIPSNALIQKAD